MRNHAPPAREMVPALLRPAAAPILYLDLNHFIYLAQVSTGSARVLPGYEALFEAAKSAVDEGRVLIPLSDGHIFEVHAIQDPRQRHDIAVVMRQLSRFTYLRSRPDIVRRELDAGLSKVLGTSAAYAAADLTGRGFRWAFGWTPDGVPPTDVAALLGNDLTTSLIATHGKDGYQRFVDKVHDQREFLMLAGPVDSEVADLRENYGYRPEAALAHHHSRLDFELALREMLDAHPERRRGRLRDIVLAREIAHEWLENINRALAEASRRDRVRVFPTDQQMREVIAAMPHVQVAVSLKTRYHQDPHHTWTTNDLNDIDAMSVAFAYCDAVFTDKAVRSALSDSVDLRGFSTFLPRRVPDLVAWLEALPRSSA